MELKKDFPTVCSIVLLPLICPCIMAHVRITFPISAHLQNDVLGRSIYLLVCM